MTVRKLVAALALMGLVLTACGGDDGKKIVDQATESSDDPPKDDGSTKDKDKDDSADPSDPDPGDIDLGDIDPGDLGAAEDIIDQFLPEGCAFFFDFSLAVSLALGGQSDISDFSASDAPEEIRDDVKTVLDALGGSNAPADLAAAFSDPAVEDALDNIDTFSTLRCDVTS